MKEDAGGAIRAFVVPEPPTARVDKGNWRPGPPPVPGDDGKHELTSSSIPPIRRRGWIPAASDGNGEPETSESEALSTDPPSRPPSTDSPCDPHVLIALGLFDEAKVAFHNILRIGVDIEDSVAGLAAIELLSGRVNEARQFAEQLLRNNPLSVRGYAMAGVLEAASAGPHQACATLEQFASPESLPDPLFELWIGWKSEADGTAAARFFLDEEKTSNRSGPSVAATRAKLDNLDGRFEHLLAQYPPTVRISLPPALAIEVAVAMVSADEGHASEALFRSVIHCPGTGIAGYRNRLRAMDWANRLSENR